MPRALIACLLFGFTAAVSAQLPKPSGLLRKVERHVPALDRILQTGPAITTSLDDARTELPMFDDYTPPSFEPMTSLPRGPHGGFLVRPGAYELSARSYCLHPGTAGPGSGNGYVLAPLAGPRAPMIRHIVQATVSHPEIPQRDVVMLIWSILVHAKYDTLRPELHRTAAALMTADEIEDLRGSGLDVVSAKARKQAFAKLPRLARQTLAAEADLREMLADSRSSFEDMERVAVLTGTPAFEKGDRVVPRERWSYDPDGYYVRYHVIGFSHTIIQLVVPGPVTEERDGLGRIVRLSGPSGQIIETEYDDRIAPFEVPGDPGVKGYAFRRIRYVRPTGDGLPPLTAEWTDTGWTFVGVPNGRGRTGEPERGNLSSATREPAAWLRPIGVRLVLARGDWFARPGFAPGLGRRQSDDSRFREWRERYEQGAEFKQQYDDFRESFDRGRQPRSWEDVEQVTNEQHYKEGLEAATGVDLAEKGEWIGHHTDLVTRAWQFVNCMMGGGCGDDAQDAEYDPSKNVAVPGQHGRQRLLPSAVSR